MIFCLQLMLFTEMFLKLYLLTNLIYYNFIQVVYA